MFVNAISEKDKRLIAKGKAEGKAEERAKSKKALKQMAQQMKSDGVAIEVISKYTGLNPQELEAL